MLKYSKEEIFQEWIKNEVEKYRQWLFSKGEKDSSLSNILLFMEENISPIMQSMLTVYPIDTLINLFMIEFYGTQN